jgi:hypothetical protein
MPFGVAAAREALNFESAVRIRERQPVAILNPDSSNGRTTPFGGGDWGSIPWSGTEG